MEFLESSRSARKYEPSRTARYRRADPRRSTLVLGFDRNRWETTNEKIQKQVMNGSGTQGRKVVGERKMTSSRKRGMLESTLSLGNAVNEWRTESKQHYHNHDLKSWGPRSLAQRDSYSWTDEDRRKLTALRDANNSQVAPDISHYTKLPPIYARPETHMNGYIDNSGEGKTEKKSHVRRANGRRTQRYSDNDDI